MDPAGNLGRLPIPIPQVLAGPSFRRVSFSLFMQVTTVAILFRQMQDTGLMETVGSYATVYNPWSTPCGLLPDKEYVILSDRIITTYGTLPGYVHVRGGLIAAVSAHSATGDRHRHAAHLTSRPNLTVIDYGSAVVGPGLVDVHVHMNEPGREDWEGMATATSAAAAGGITTVIDMPLNSNPCTTTVAELRRKIDIAKSPNKTYVDVGFWAGLVPENAYHPHHLKALIKAGALGFKSFMAPSGIDDFPNVSIKDIRAALPVLRKLQVPLLVHSELVDDEAAQAVKGMKPNKHSTWLASRPPRFEQNAVKALIQALDDLESNAGSPCPPGFMVHIVHIADIDTLKLVVAARSRGLPISAETCPHYLLFAADDVRRGDTRFKCAPPLRNAANRAALLAALAANEFDSLATDHSPSPPSMKALDTGNFMTAWGGIAGLQYALPASWEALQQAGNSGASVDPARLHDLWSRFPAALAGLSRSKGALKSGMQADIVVWNPDVLADTSTGGLYHKHKVTPYEGRKLRGKVIATFVRGSKVFDGEQGVSKESCGLPLITRKPPRE